MFNAVCSGHEKTRLSCELNVRNLSISRFFPPPACDKTEKQAAQCFILDAIWSFYLESLAAPGEPRGQRVRVGDDDQSKEDSQRQQPDERPPPAVVAAAVVTG